MAARALLVVALLAGFALAARAYRSWRTGLGSAPDHHGGDHPLVPAALRAGAERTWVLFTTPYCGACGPLEHRLRASDPTARVVTVDATRDQDLADAFSVRSAPTVLLADGEGRVQARLVGAEAVDRYVRNPA